METGRLVVERVGGKSTLTSCFSKYPLKFIIPRKVGSSQTDAVWIYSITYGGGIVCGDSIKCDVTVADGCTAVLTTQASTKVYKSVAGSKCCEQVLGARIASDSLLAVIPDPVTCFSTAKYYQKQVFRISPDSNLLLVDWITSGRLLGRGEKWDFEFYKSSNHIFLEADEPLFLDTVLLEQDKCGCSSVAARMQEYQVIAMVVVLGPKLKFVQNRMQDDVKNYMSQKLHNMTKPDFIVSSSVFGRKEVTGVVVRIAATTTESVYSFLQCHLSGLEPLLGVSPYS